MPATNVFQATDTAINSPYTRAKSLTLSDTVDLTEVPRALHIHAGTASTPVKVIFEDDTVAVTLQLQTGFIYPLRVTRVYATGTSATTVIALY